jgi:hypothetical protein
MQPLSDHELATELRALRPTPEPEFASELDARVAAGFEEGGSRAGVFDRLRAWLRPTRHRLLTASAAGAVAAVAIATVVIAPGGDEPTESNPSSSLGFLNLAEDAPPEAEIGAGATGEAIVPRAQSAPSSPIGPYASQTGDREVERSATIFLRTEAGDVRRASADVFSAVHAVDGIVLSSSVEEGEGGGANFELLVPSGKLGDALASFSEIAEVASREESTADVTARTVGLNERLEDGRATVDSLLAQLAAAETEAERAAAEAELRAERRHVAALRAQLSDLQRRTNFARVSLQIVTDDSGAPAGYDGSWGIGAALDDAGRILETAAAVALVGIAVLAPFALLALLAWLARRRWLTASRQRALG